MYILSHFWFGPRLVKQYHQVDNLQEELLAENTYNDLGELINKKTSNITGTPLQSLDYAYNIRGWLTSVNNPNTSSFNSKLFGFELKYENPVNTAFAPARYNGNIAEFDWKTTNGNVLRRYAYKYDKIDRLTDASYHEPFTTVPVTNGFGEFLTYDPNGNIKTLKRYQAYNNTAMLIDDLDYSIYKGNQLIKVTDNSNNNLGYLTGGNTIDYDVNGNMINHLDKGITNISYNFLNLPKEVNFAQNNNNLKFIYRADGIKLKKTYTYYASKSGMMITNTTDYLDGFQYEGNGSIYNLQFFPTQEGYYDYQNKRYIYNYTDIWGNIRLAYYKDANNIATIDKETNYYPFGLEYAGYNGTYPQNQNYRYGFQGQERQQETGWGAFKWRNTIPELGRFFNVDPLAEKYAYNSPFAFQENKIGRGRELEGLELVPFEFLVMSNSSVRPTIAETMIREAPIPIEEVVITGRAMPPSPPGFWEKIGNWFDSVFDSSGESTAPKTMDKTVENIKPESATESATNETGKIYRVPGKQTETGKPYIGRTKRSSPVERGRSAKDGRDRGGETEVIDKYDPSKPGEGAYKEQKAIDKEGGVENLDNKRNEVKPERMKDLENKYGPKHQ